MKLSKTEEKLMQILWELKKAFMKDILGAYQEPKPASTTVSTLLKRMKDKGYVSYKSYGNSREYYPLIAKEKYFSKHVNGLIRDFFDNSAGQFASFFTKETDLSTEELEKLRVLIDERLKEKK